MARSHATSSMSATGTVAPLSCSPRIEAPASPHTSISNAARAAAEMVPMLHDWSAIAMAGDRLVLWPA